MDCSTPGSSVLHYLLEFAQIHVHWVSVLYCPLLYLPSIFSSIKVSSNESALWIRWPKYWSSDFSISPSSEYSGLIFFRIDGFNLPAVQGALKSLPQHHISKAPVLWCSAFFMDQLSHPYMTTGKTIALADFIGVGKEEGEEEEGENLGWISPNFLHCCLSNTRECVHVCAQSCPTLCSPMDCSPPASSAHWIFQARMLEWVAISTPGDPPETGIEPVSPASSVSPALASELFTTEPLGKSQQ